MTDESPQKISLFKQQPLGVVALALAIVAIVFAALAWQQYSVVHDDIGDRTTKLQQSFSQLQSDFQQYQLQSQTATQNNEKNIALLMNQSNDAKTASILTETGYLIRLADLHLDIENNVADAIRLLKIAQTRLQPLTSASVQPLKEAVNHDITALTAIPQINVNDISNQIDQLSKQIANIEIQSPIVNKATSITTTSMVATTSWWDKIKHNLGGLKDLFIVRHIEDSDVGPITSKQFVLLQESIRLKLMQAQWALLYLQKNIYQQSLNTAAQWLNELNQNQPATSELIKKLEALAVIDIKPQAPTLQSIAVLQSMPESTPALNQTETKPESAHP
jgi:uroporphyrin-3 C-methyltransferase